MVSLLEVLPGNLNSAGRSKQLFLKGDPTFSKKNHSDIQWS